MSSSGTTAPDLELLRAFSPTASDEASAHPTIAAASDAEGTDVAAVAVRHDARARLLAAIASEQERLVSVRAGGATAAASRRRALRRRAAGGALALGAALVVLAVGIGGGNHDAPTPGIARGGGLVSSLVGVPSASASDALRAAAAAAVGQPTVPFTADTAWVVRTERAELILNHGQVAIGPDGKPAGPVPSAFYAAVRLTRGSETTTFDGKVVASVAPYGMPRFTTKASADAYREVGAPTSSKGSTYPIIYPGDGTPKPFVAGSKSLSYADVQAIPTDTPSLARWVKDAASTTDGSGVTTGGDDFAQIQVITGLMLRAPLQPALRAGLWRVAAQLPGLKLLGPMKDPAGRSGTGLAITAGDDREQIVFSPQTGMLLSAWIYKRSAVTTCDKDLEYCDARQQRAGDHGKPWTLLAVPGTVESGTTVLSAAVEPR